MSHQQAERVLLHGLILAQFWSASATHELNRFIEFGDANGNINTWRSTSDFVPIQGGLFGNITIGQVMDMEFDFIWWGYSDDPNASGQSFENFFRIGFSHHDGTSCNGQGSRYPSFWVTPRQFYDGLPYLHVSTSYGTTHCQPEQRLTEFGPISIGEPYHIKISTNSTFTTVAAASSSKSGIYPFPRDSPTQSAHLGRVAGVWFMSGKFGSTEYNRGNGTFSNIILTSSQYTDVVEDEESIIAAPSTSSVATPPPSTSAPTTTSDPTNRPTDVPTWNENEVPIPDTVTTTMIVVEVVSRDDDAAFSMDSVFVIGAAIVLLFVLVISIACCIVAYLCGRHHDRLKNESIWLDSCSTMRATAISELDQINCSHEVRMRRMAHHARASAIVIPNISSCAGTKTSNVVDEDDSDLAAAANLQLPFTPQSVKRDERSKRIHSASPTDNLKPLTPTLSNVMSPSSALYAEPEGVLGLMETAAPPSVSSSLCSPHRETMKSRSESEVLAMMSGYLATMQRGKSESKQTKGYVD